jgi:hypothetical protein
MRDLQRRQPYAKLFQGSRTIAAADRGLRCRAAEFETYDRSVLKNDVLYAFFMIKNRVKNVLQ